MNTLSASDLEKIVTFLASACGVLTLVLAVVVVRLRALGARLADADYQNRSLSSTYGRISEQWFPLMESYPYDPQGFRFLGNPVDGVQFEEDRIVFVEFKANRSKLSSSQRQIKRLVQDGKVYWEEFRFTEPPEDGSAEL